MNDRWCVRCGKDTPTPFLVKCFRKMGSRLDGMSVADIGCGNGRNSRYAKSLGAETVAFDMCGDYGTPLILGKDKFPVKDGSFDIVLANYIFMFLDKKEIEFVLKELSRIIRPDASLIWELYPAKDSFYPDAKSIMELNNSIRDRFSGMRTVYFTKDKGFIKGE